MSYPCPACGLTSCTNTQSDAALDARVADLEAWKDRHIAKHLAAEFGDCDCGLPSVSGSMNPHAPSCAALKVRKTKHTQPEEHEPGLSEYQRDAAYAAVNSALRHMAPDHPARPSVEHARFMLVPPGLKTRPCPCGCGDLQILWDKS